MASLEEVLKRKRELLTEYLLLNGTYENLRKELQQIELKKLEKVFKTSTITHDGSMVHELLLGKVGKVTNRNRAIFELPTHELVYALEKVAEKLGFDKIAEVRSGTGILSWMINMLTSLEATPYDSKNRGLTCGKPYMGIKKKHIMDFVVHPLEDDNLLVFNHCITTNGTVINGLMKKTKPKAFICVGQFYKNLELFTFINRTANTFGYDIVCLPVKQICYLDAFGIIPELEDHVSRSCLTIFIRKENPVINLSDHTFDKWKEVIGDELMGKETIDEMSLNTGYIDIWLNGNISGKVLELEFKDGVFKCNLSDAKGKKLASVLNSIYIPNKLILKIPSYLKNDKEIKFWDELDRKQEYPKLIKDRETFKEFFEMYSNCSRKWEIYKKNKIIPSWVNTGEVARKCIIKLFSTTSSKWRASLNAMNAPSISNSIFGNMFYPTTSLI